ncbi:hypothetical protein PAXRUDRAFT_504727 [Paxillus rubicundulus Ve08.2h10]|uniref:Uncharacterized protein n=1 Tax=Paxillus rubicundulus Ve08.2h10 TaxID=930991 RepID=A0A0D0DW85_9AGAM|nr:hypothetical protein PAXRUDRAFT_504727 [Paxillus rubicundulus Ve08.2h10]
MHATAYYCGWIRCEQSQGYQKTRLVSHTLQLFTVVSSVGAEIRSMGWLSVNLEPWPVLAIIEPRAIGPLLYYRLAVRVLAQNLRRETSALWFRYKGSSRLFGSISCMCLKFSVSYCPW